MRAFHLLVLLGLALSSACLTPVTEGDGGQGGGSAGGTGGGGTGGGGGGGTGGGTGGGVGGGTGGGAANQCFQDSECPAGQVCYRCEMDRPGQCLTGCNAGHPCPAGQSCLQLDIVCIACPCLDSLCQGPTCFDEDGDGYVAGVGCSSLPGGDCAPTDPTVHPGAGERCNNQKDDDCDGLVDSADPDCGPTSCTGGPSCLSSWNCGIGSGQCNQGCCQGCPVYSPPKCQAGECPLPPTVDPTTGCFAGSDCAPCTQAICPAVYQPVCAATSDRFTDPRTFGNGCEAARAHAIVFHDGPCLTGEGVSCGMGGPGCGSGTELYCRDACPECDAEILRCTQKGVCATRLDCPAGLPPLPPITCSTGPSVVGCVDHQCVRVCPP